MQDSLKEYGIFLIEDHPESIQKFHKALEGTEYKIRIEASTFRQVLLIVAGDLLINLNYAFVDGNLSKGKSDGEEGDVIVRLLHLQYPKLEVVGHSWEKDIPSAIPINFHKKNDQEDLLNWLRARDNT